MAKKSLSADMALQKLRAQLDRLLVKLYPNDQIRREQFSAAYFSKDVSKPALIWLTKRPTTLPFTGERLTHWQPDYIDFVKPATEVRPAQLPLYDAGAYYPLDFSSIATVSPILTLEKPIQTVLDVCSSPGGKALFAWATLNPTTLICNEVIGKRHRPLQENISRCHIPATITQLDPSQLGEKYREHCDLVMVDAPCSGQSLPARGIPASGAFQDYLVNMNMARQRRILANVIPCIKPGGYLLYTTCTYSREENEKNVSWLLEHHPRLQALPIPHLSPYQSKIVTTPCYRIEPHDGLGSGGFSCLFRYTETGVY